MSNLKPMKKKIFVALLFASLGLGIFVACKKESNDGISVGYKDEKGTGNNPYPNGNTSSTASAAT